MVSPGDLAKVEIPPGQILFEKERSIEIFLYLWRSSPGSVLGKGGRILRLVRSKAQRKNGREIDEEMLMVMRKVMEGLTLSANIEGEELVVAVEVELFSSVPEFW